MTDAIDENLRGRCQMCHKVLALDELVVGWYDHWIDDVDGVPQERVGLPDLLIGVTHPGRCAEAYREARGDDCPSREFPPYQFVPVCKPD